jgi:hypothetical protein
MPKLQAIPCKMLVNGSPRAGESRAYHRRLDRFFDRANDSGHKIALLPHRNPDLDAICAAAVAQIMIPKSQIFITGAPLTSVLRVVRDFSIDARHYSMRNSKEFPFGIAIDTSTSERIPSFYKGRGRLLGLFNHKSEGDLMANWLSIEDGNFSSTCELFASAFINGRVLGHDNESRRIANLLLIGIFYDTYNLSRNIINNDVFGTVWTLLNEHGISYARNVSKYIWPEYTPWEKKKYTSLFGRFKALNIGDVSVAVIPAQSEFEMGATKYLFNTLPFDIMVSMSPPEAPVVLYLRSKGQLNCGRIVDALKGKFPVLSGGGKDSGALVRVDSDDTEGILKFVLEQIKLQAEKIQGKQDKEKQA